MPPSRMHNAEFRWNALLGKLTRRTQIFHV